MLLGHVVRLVERFHHFGLHPFVDLINRPVVATDVLDPLEVRNCNATGVAQEVGNDLDSTLAQNLVGFRRGWTIGGLGDDFGLNVGRIPVRDDVFDGCRD